MNAKIERINSEIDKNKGKISELQAKNRELEKQRTDLENAEIVDAVRGMDISLADLAAFMKKGNAPKGSGAAATSGQNVPKSETPKNEQEDN